MKINLGVIGAGVIGAGWIARLVYHGFDVKVYDPTIEAKKSLVRVMENAHIAYVNAGKEVTNSQYRFYDCMEDFCQDTDVIIECIPESLSLKQQLINEIEKYASPQCVISSSTSGFMPSQLQQNTKHPERILVSHPFNPVYLIPLIEVVYNQHNTLDYVQIIENIVRQTNGFALLINHEIPGHIADRLLESVWREALWLIHDGVATTEQIDQAISYGFGLRWAQMGLFETYRIAGGEGGMKHFIQQFAPALKWPWTKLMDVPELNEELADKIAHQSNQHSGQYSIQELEQIRDHNLVAFMQVLQKHHWGVGQHTTFSSTYRANTIESEQPQNYFSCLIDQSFIDHNQHMGESGYYKLCSFATDTMLALIGIDRSYITQGKSVYSVQSNIRHLNECYLGDRVSVRTQLLDFDHKRLWINHQLQKGEKIICTCEQILVHVDRKQNKSTPMPEHIRAKLQEIQRLSHTLPIPEYCAKGIQFTRQ